MGGEREGEREPCKIKMGSKAVKIPAKWAEQGGREKKGKREHGWKVCVYIHTNSIGDRQEASTDRHFLSMS